MKVSFLVTYYNQEQYVKQSMDSILAIHKPLNWEILVGDDGSTDRTVKIVNEYINRDPLHIRLFTMPREKGRQYDSVKRASANRINLLEHCTGDFFCILDGDDFYYDYNFVMDAIEIFERNPDIVLVMFGYRYFRDGVLEKEKLLPADVDRYVDTKYYIKNLYLHAGAGVHKLSWDGDRMEYIKRIGYFDDNDIVMNTLNFGSMYYINRAIYAYRQTGESVYTSMHDVEKAVLNVLGYDVDCKLIDALNPLLIRNGVSILTMYIWRNKLKKILGILKYNIYLESCNDIEGALSFQLLNYESLSKEERKAIKKIIIYLKKNLCWKFLKLQIKYFFRGIL